MSESVETLAAKLLAAAIKEGRDDYVQALQNLVPPLNALEQLKTDVFQFDENWRQRLLRTDYTSDEARSMFSEDLIKNPKFVEFIVEAAGYVTEKSTQYSLIKNMLGASLYSAAKSALEKVSDVADFSNWLSTRTTYFSRANKHSYFYTIGEETAFSRDAAVLFDQLDLEVPDSFDGQYVGKKIRWSASKFDAVVDWVSEICEAPRAKVGKDGELEISKPLLITAFREERGRVDSKGEWHQNVFPKLVPVLAGEAESEVMLAKGFVKLTPEYGFVGESEKSGYFENNANHGFSSPTHPGLDQELINGAMTFLSHEDITKLRADGSKDSVFLVSANDDLQLINSGATPESLRIAMRYHRPEFLCSRYEGNLYEFERSGLCTRGYLRGMPIHSNLRGSLSIQGETLESPVYLDALASRQEMDLLKELHNPSAREPKHASIRQIDVRGDLQEEARQAVSAYRRLSDKIGFVPATLFKGTEAFLHEVAGELTRQGLEVSSSNATRYTENPGTTSVNSTQRRLDARLGCLRWSEFKSIPADELLTKGARLKGEHDREKICGILDRLGVLEVARLAKTPAQRKFVVENFDVQAHYKDMPKAIRLAVGGKILEDDLGM